MLSQIKTLGRTPKKSDLKSRARGPYHDCVRIAKLGAKERIKPTSPGKIIARHLAQYGHTNHVPKDVMERHFAHERAKVGIKKRILQHSANSFYGKLANTPHLV